MKTKLWIAKAIALFVALVLVGVGILPVQSQGGLIDGVVEGDGEEGILEPDRGYAPALALTRAQQQALQNKLLALRERYAAQVDNHVGEVPDSATEFYSEPTEIGESLDAMEGALLPTPTSFYTLNNKNTRASTVGSNLAEPAAINEGQYVFYSGNTHAEYSLNRGATWTAKSIPAGPADAPYACCDIDVVYDRARGLTIWSVLYLNAAGTNGVVRTFVNRTVNGNYACSYTWDPAGTSNNTVPDYPHLGLTNNYLYLTTNNIGGAAGGRAQVRRISLDNMGNCVSAGYSTYSYTWTYGQRVFVPVEGARDIMYWGAMYNSSTFRVYKWPENTGTISSIDRTVATSNFTNPDCRGGTGNYDFIQKDTAWSILGFRMRGAVGPQGLAFYWNVGTDSSHPQGHVHSAVFRESDMSLIAQPHIWSSSLCFGYPAVSVNDRGDFGLSIAAGGKAGGGGSAAQGYVGIDDEYTSGVGYFGTVYLTASGTHNRSDGRFGDYFTVRRQTPCGLYFAATNYALSGGTATANVNARYVEFGRGRDYVCWYGWSGRYRAP